MLNPKKIIQKIGRKVVLGFGVSFIVLIFIGIYSFQNLTQLKTNTLELANPNELVVTLQQVISDISHIEQGVLTYLNTDDPDYLIPYYNFTDSVEPKLKKIDSLTASLKNYEIRTDSILYLYSLKKDIMNMLVEVDTDKLNKLFYDTIKKEFRKRKKNKLSNQNEMPGNQKHLYAKIIKLFNEKQSDDVEALTKIDASEETELTLDEVIDMIVGSPDSMSQNDLRSVDFIARLFEKDYAISHEIRTIANAMLLNEIINREIRKERAGNITRRSIITLSFIISLNLILIIILLGLIFRDLFKTRKYQTELLKAHKEAEQASVLKSNFLATMSHEIRTPLTTIIGFNDLLAKSDLNPEQKNHIAVVESASNHLLKVIDKILTLSKIQAGQINIENKAFNLPELINNIHNSLKYNAQAKGINFFIHCPEANDLWVSGDYIHARQILTNVISNAIKFTSKGSVGVFCRYREQEHSKLLMEFLIRDSGMGIPDEKINQIFAEFNQIDFTATRKYGGTGLGLTISQKLADLMGGSIKVKSIPEKGSTFIITLPFEKVSEEEFLKETKPKAPGNMQMLKHVTAMVVDDDEINATLSQRVLQNFDVETDMVLLPMTALEKFKQKHYDVVLLDIHMPEMSGYEVAREMRQWEIDNNLEQSVIIAFTADVMQDDITKFTRFGISGYTEKPFKEKDIYNILCYHLALDNEFSDSAWAPAGIEPNSIEDEDEEESDETYDLEELRSATGGDQGFYLKMLGTFIENTEAGNKELQNAIENNDWKNAGEQAHKLKTMHRHLHINNLAKLYYKIETMALKEKKYDEIESLLLKITPASKKIIASLKNELSKADIKDE